MMITTTKHQITDGFDQLGLEIVKAIKSHKLRVVESQIDRLVERLESEQDTLRADYLTCIKRLILRYGLSEVPRWNDSELAGLITKGAFIDRRGRVLFIGPTGPRRSGVRHSAELTAVYGTRQELFVILDGGRRIELDGFSTDVDSDSIRLVPFVPLAVAGLFEEFTDEYFVPGDFWRIGEVNNNSRIPSFLNVERVRVAAEQIGRHLISAMFDTKSAEALLTWLDDPTRALRLIALEYLKHESGHKSNPELLELAKSEFSKKNRMLIWGCGEALADARTNSNCFLQYISGSDEEQDIHKVTMMIRILDLAREARRGAGGDIPLDVDVLAALKWWEQLVCGGTLFWHKKIRRLGLAEQYPFVHGEIDATPSNSRITMPHIVWPMQDWGENFALKLNSAGSSTEVLKGLVMDNEVSNKLRRHFLDFFLNPIREKVPGIEIR